MRYNALLGVSCIERGWVPSPSYALRRSRILRTLDRLPAGRALEFGCGAGGLLFDLARRGFECDAVEVSPTARQLAEFINSGSVAVRIYESIPGGRSERYDYVLAFEVLEHVADDQGALMEWASYLRPGGRLLVSVPAHPKRWNASDVWAGHVRRYTSSDLRDRIEGAGLTLEHIEHYGFPLTNITDPIRARVHRARLRLNQSDSEDPYQKSLRSGIDRPVEGRLYPFLSSAVGLLLLRVALGLQHLFSRMPLGNGILAVAKRPH
jgi:SAM-dependent methyltransferase